MKRIKDPAHMARVATFPCVLIGTFKHECRGRTTVQHCQGVIWAGMGQKAHDTETFPLCVAHHLQGPNAIENMGSKAWERKYGEQGFWLDVTRAMLKKYFPDHYK